jgi:phage replication O-like protein O
MANVQPENGYTKIADEILEQMARIKLSPTQYRILFVVWRFTYGFNRKEHELTLGFISNATGCDKRQLQRELKSLEQRNVISQKVINGVGRKIRFNKNHDEWIGKTAIGEITIGETDNGETINPSNGETDNGTIGETDNQEIHSLNTSLQTVSQLEGELSDSEIMDRACEVEKHYCKNRGILDCSSTDFHEIKILVASKIPVDFINSSLDRTFLEYKPKYPKDQIRTFSYCATACYERWNKHIEKNKPLKDGEYDAKKFEGQLQHGGNDSKNKSVTGDAVGWLPSSARPANYAQLLEVSGQ